MFSCILERGDKVAKNHREVKQKPLSRPAFTGDEREKRMISLAMDLAEKKLLDGTASNQTICHFLKLGSSKEKLEKEILERQKELMQAKTEALQSAKHVEELYSNALEAMRSYSGQVSDEELF